LIHFYKRGLEEGLKKGSIQREQKGDQI